MLGKKTQNGKITEKDILAALGKVQERERHNDLVSLKMVKDIHINGGQVGFTIVLTTPACPLRGQMERESQAAVMALPGVEQVVVKFDANVRGDARIAGRLVESQRPGLVVKKAAGWTSIYSSACLLYTSDAADDLLCVDLGGRRSITKKKKNKLPSPHSLS